MLLIDRSLFDHDHHAHLAAAVRGHAAILAMIEAHRLEHEHERQLAEEAHHAELERRALGGT